MGEIALVMTVRDERDLLRDNLRYHHFLGVDRCYVYDDGSTDGTMETVADLPYVIARRSSDAASLPIPPTLTDTPESFKSQFPWRQLLNISQVIAEAPDSGVAWVVAIDADELVAIDLTEPTPGGLRALLDSLPARTEGVIFPVLEVLQRRVSYSNVMAQETLFKRTASRLKRKTYNPFTGTHPSVPVVYGHRSGKMAVRVAAEPYPRTNHRFAKANKAPLHTRTMGRLLHYYSHDLDAFMHKLRLISDYPDHHIHGQKVPLQKRLWRDVVNRGGLDAKGLRDYYERWVMFDEHQVAAMRRRSLLPWRDGTVLVDVTSVRDTLRELDAERSSAAPTVS